MSSLPEESFPETAQRYGGSSETTDIGDEYEIDPQPPKSPFTGATAACATWKEGINSA